MDIFEFSPTTILHPLIGYSSPPRIVLFFPIAFNEERTVGSIVRQAMRYTDEVIVVDDGSNDETVENAR